MSTRAAVGEPFAKQGMQLYRYLGGLMGRGTLRFAVLLVAFACGLTLSLLLAWLLRFDFVLPEQYAASVWHSILWIVPMKILVLYFTRQFSGLLTFFSIRDLVRLFGALAGSMVIILLVRTFVAVDYSPYTLSRGVILVDFVLSFVGLAGFRVSLRLFRERMMFRAQTGQERARTRVAIVGAGHFGSMLAKDLFTRHGLGMRPVLFFDDSPDKWKTRLHDLEVVGKPELLLKGGLASGVDEVIIALPGGASKRIREVVLLAQKAGLKCQTVPSMEELATGKVTVSQLRDVQIQDLLGRDSVELETENIRQLIVGKTIMVTGAGGSIGSELCRQIVANQPQRLLLVEQCEVQLFQIEQELKLAGYDGCLTALIADILDKDRMHEIFYRFKPDGVFHAAAHKHVPMMESQPVEAFKNNSMGTRLLAELAESSGVDFFLLVSTDKAINPTSVMGATKRLAEIFLQSFNGARAKGQQGTKFMAVRFGNVLGSSGSVVPIFERQIAAGGPVKVTHPEMTRYFMTIPEAVGLVLQSAVNAHGGEIFVLNMGEPVKIVDLARNLIELHGQKPGVDIDIEFSGLRPGEKLFEEVSHSAENLTETAHPEIMRYVCEPQPIDVVRQAYDTIHDSMHLLEPEALKRRLQAVIPEYTPFFAPPEPQVIQELRSAVGVKGDEDPFPRGLGIKSTHIA